ncbi:uncharacterized protein LOC141899782 isoform X2 [Tubulanus polymorphus]|uniref:uncharacterized protein LOC141899782 isoform X2 n=1 Tax=Tubulanus polymorphus TaxID=672921 RepID=UPI003DA24CFD
MDVPDIPVITFDKCYDALLEQEETCWTTPEGLQDHETESAGSILLKAAKTHSSINQYFSKFKPHKCRAKLTSIGCKTSFSSVRVVRGSIKDLTLEEGAMTRDRKEKLDVKRLSDDDHCLYKDAFLCALYPKLCAPDLPSPTPPKMIPRRHSVAEYRLEMHQIPVDNPQMEVDDCDENTSVISSETLCDLIRHAFGLDRDATKHYDRMIAGMLHKKSHARLLAEELKMQLTQLENNNDPFYNPHNFVSPHAYDQWQQWRRKQIMLLVSKFWTSSLPHQSFYRLSLPSRHQQYHALMKKLLRYESTYRFQVDGVENETIKPTYPQSSATKRLLKEFGLRYGVCDMFQKVIYLQYLTENFEHYPWFVNHVSTIIDEISLMLPASQQNIVMVKKELEILTETLTYLHKQCENSLTRVKRLFPGNKPSDGITAFLDLLEKLLLMKSFFAGKEDISVKDYVLKYMRESFSTAYERHKMLLIDELELDTFLTSIHPCLLNKLLHKIEDEVTDYKANYNHSFKRYCNIAAEAAQTFYMLLMADVALLCEEFINKPPNDENMVLMISLAYSLKCFDEEWNCFLTDDMKTWHSSFYPLGQVWLSTIKTHLQCLVIDTIEHEEFDVITIPYEPSAVISTTHHRLRSSLASLTQSWNSAFSSHVQSNSNSPREQSTPRSKRRTPIQQIGSETPIPENLEASLTDNQTTVSVDLHPIPHQISTPLAIKKDIMHVTEPVLSTSLDPNIFRDAPKIEIRQMSCDDTDVLFFSRTNRLHHSISSPTMRQHQKSKSKRISFSSRSETLDTSSETSEVSTGKTSQEFENQLITEFMHKHHANAYSELSPEEQRKLKKVVRLMIETVSSNEYLNVHESDDKTVGDPVTENIHDHSIYTYMSDLMRFPRMIASSPSANLVYHSPTSNQNKKKTPRRLKPIPVSKVEVSEVGAEKPKDTNFDASSKPGTSQMDKSVDSHKVNDPSYLERFSSAVRSLKDSLFQWGNDKKDIEHSIKDCGEYENEKCPAQDDQSKAKVSSGNPSDPKLLLVTSSMLDVAIIIHRYTKFAQCLLFGTLMPLLPSLQVGGNLIDNPLFIETMQIREKLYSKFVLGVCAAVILYCDNLMCIDLCGAATRLGIKILGRKMINHLSVQFNSGLIWGCRHSKDPDGDCFRYIDCNAKVIADKYEPITKEMCFRINNMYSLLQLITKIQNSVEKAADVEGMTTLKKEAPQTENDNYDYGREHEEEDESDNIEDEKPVENTLLNEQTFQMCMQHVQSLLMAQLKLLAYRVNLFIKETLQLLLDLPMKSESISYRMKPVLEFLEINFKALSRWLYGDMLRRVQTELWHLLVANMSNEVDKLTQSPGNTERKAKIMIQALAVLIQFMHENGSGMNLQELVDDTETVLLKLNLYSESTAKLIALYRQLSDAFDDDVDSTDSSMPPPDYMEFMQHDLHAIRKCFSGKQLIDWIKKHPMDKFVSKDTTTSDEQAVMTLAQTLLDEGVICSVDDHDMMAWGNSSGVSSVPSETSSLESGYYPPITPCTSASVSRAMTLSYSTESEKDSDCDEKHTDRNLSDENVLKPEQLECQQGIKIIVSNHQNESTSLQAGNSLIENGHIYETSEHCEHESVTIETNNNSSKDVSHSSPDDQLNSVSICDIENDAAENDEEVIAEVSLIREKDECKKESNDENLVSVIENIARLTPLDRAGSSNSVRFTLNQTDGVSDASSRTVTPASTISQHSSFSNLSISPSVLFYPSTKQYYCFTNNLDISLDVRSITSSKLEDFLTRIQAHPQCRNEGTLLRSAIEKKIPAIFLVTILYTRRKRDKLAKNFISRVPKDEIYSVKHPDKVEPTGCFG